MGFQKQLVISAGIQVVFTLVFTSFRASDTYLQTYSGKPVRLAVMPVPPLTSHEGGIPFASPIVRAAALGALEKAATPWLQGTEPGSSHKPPLARIPNARIL